jgi:hypothetical protein
MNSTSSCPRCGRPSPSGNSYCANCGASLSSRSGGKGWKLFFGAFAIFVGLLWGVAIFTRPGPASQPAGASQSQTLLGSGANTTGAPAAQPTPQPALTLTSAQHLAEAKRALAEGYKPDKDPQKAKWGEVATAKWHLKTIGAAAAEYREAQELLKEVARRERQMELAKKQAREDQESDKSTAADASDDDSEASLPATTSSPASSSASTPNAARQSPTPATAGGSSSSDYYTNSRGVRVRRPTPSENGPPPGATAQCRDGSYSFSQSRRGTCSHHGGVSRWL